MEKKDKLTNYAIILASGTGSRFGAGVAKQFLKIDNKTLLEYTIENFQNCRKIDKIIITVSEDNIQNTQNLLTNKYDKLYKIVKGGCTRQESAFNALNAIDDTEANVLIHDGARPFTNENIINECIKHLDSGIKALTTAIDSADTIVKVEDNKILSMPERQTLKRVQTPQGFKLSVIKQAHELAAKDNYNYTDDCGIIVKNNLAEVFVIKGDNDNIKITYPQDLELAKQIIKKRES